ncbi:hypothetical protein E4K66_19105 [Bradyrhizobium frederickii]|uniref:Uncharacterized protein n=1 Tax=Bradyrhizobium frederickii TaxID=2560054 RepID=A0A4Y9L208_9BRAD|nr:hypothetical protein [Bradyrhizobium frederickii]TFV37631.1 hypothetical protein E4K66_19105 [Bradyrhizobium frederickii]
MYLYFNYSESGSLRWYVKVSRKLDRPQNAPHYIAQANREKLGISGMEKIVTFDQSQSLDDWPAVPRANSTRTPRRNRVVTFPGNTQKKV